LSLRYRDISPRRAASASESVAWTGGKTGASSEYRATEGTGR
jgi:hypothetical protein